MDAIDFDFPYALDLRESPPFSGFELLHDFVYIDSDGRSYVALTGLCTDLWSVPSALRPLVAVSFRPKAPAVIHDMAYKCQWFGPDGQKHADKLLLELMQVCNLKAKHAGIELPFPRRLMWRVMAGLKLGGWRAYAKRRKNYEALKKHHDGRRPMDHEIMQSKITNNRNK